jgi:hypothetical protein
MAMKATSQPSQVREEIDSPTVEFRVETSQKKAMLALLAVRLRIQLLKF